MMKMIFKGGSGLLLAAAVLLSGVQAVLAASVNTPIDFCDRLDALEKKAIRHFDDHSALLETARAKREAILLQQHSDRMERLKNQRTQVSARQHDRFDALKNRPETVSKKESVEAFQTNMTAALARYRTALDAAITAHQAALAEVLQERQRIQDEVILAFRASIDEANAQAKTACSAGENSQSIRNSFADEISAARAQFRTERQTTLSFDEKVRELAIIKKQALAAALAEFR
ncbi:MAG: hypothetical protein Q8P82_01410, partial [bacterium]|nr:hypothetical protein [bacterium]